MTVPTRSDISCFPYSSSLPKAQSQTNKEVKKKKKKNRILTEWERRRKEAGTPFFPTEIDPILR